MDGGTAIGEERGTFSLDDFAQELAEAENNRQLGTALWFENDHVRIFEVRLTDVPSELSACDRSGATDQNDGAAG